jgi:hypothetical protein
MSDPPRRPFVRLNLDPLAALVDAALAHPAARVLGAIAPEAMGQVHEARANLPHLVAGIEARALDRVRGEIVTLERQATRALGDWLDETLTAAGKRTKPTRRLKPLRKARGR